MYNALVMRFYASVQYRCPTLLAVNGITAENIADYLDAGAVGVGVGSGIVNKK